MQRTERDVDAAVGVPGVERLGDRERRGVAVAGTGGVPGEGGRGVVERRQCGPGGDELAFDEIADGLAVGGGHLLVGDAEGADPVHRAPVGFRRAGEDGQQRGLAAAVPADDAEAGAGPDGDVDTGEDGTAAAGDVDPGGGELRRGPGGEGGGRVDGGSGGHDGSDHHGRSVGRCGTSPPRDSTRGTPGHTNERRK